MTAIRELLCRLKKFNHSFQGILLSKQFMYYTKDYFNVYEFLEEEIHGFVAKLGNRCFCWILSAIGAHPDGYQHGVSIQISINFV